MPPRLSRPVARAAAGIRSPGRTPPKSSSATPSCKRLPTNGSRHFSPSSAISRIRTSLSKAYTPACADLVSPGRCAALETLETELSQWKDAKKRDQGSRRRCARCHQLKKATSRRVVQGMKNLIAGRRPRHVSTRHSWNCAWKSVRTPSARRSRGRARCGRVRAYQTQLVRRLYKIEMPDAAGCHQRS